MSPRAYYPRTILGVTEGMAGNGDIRGSDDGRRDDEDRVQAARRLLENAREKRENPYKTPPNILTTKDHQGK